MFVLRYIHEVQAIPEPVTSKPETKETFLTLHEAMERWHFLWQHTESHVFDITNENKVYIADDYYDYCEKQGWD